MQEIAVSKLKIKCLSVIETVRRTRSPIRVTRFGKAVAEIVPVSSAPRGSWLGCMSHATETDDDIVGPLGAFDKWKTVK